MGSTVSGSISCFGEDVPIYRIIKNKGEGHAEKKANILCGDSQNLVTMAMRGKIPKEVQQIFDKYIQNNVRSLKKPAAVQMLVSEFSLSEEQANDMFENFDKDKNGIMSLNEFRAFYMCAGANAQAIVTKFQELDADGSGKLDLEEARAGLQSMKTATGRALEDKEIDFFLQTTAGEDNVIDLGHFTNLLYRLKLYKSPPPPKEGIKKF
ncbi:hypothetical protein ScPMuIL_013157 [Solemya velum]